ncbi:DUF1684 domain-containing protein [Streptomyces sp. NPDC051322]|uniref:DUF1684 domain-containing protein n=1 Tax=Streptomyces sp. NPDC051322 TaxID=3154645 RepID=UPI003450AC68
MGAGADDANSTGGAGGPGGGQDTAAADWADWHEQRTTTVSAPYGPLALTGTHWLDDAAEGLIPAVAGHGEAARDAVVLTATAEDGLTLDGEPFTGRAVLTADHVPAASARLAQGERHLVVVYREGLWAIRGWDPSSAARRAFAGIDASAYEPRWVLPGVFRPYAERRTVRVPNADGRDRGLGLTGEPAFRIGGDEHALQVATEDDGSLWPVFADAHVICPFPPPGNTLPIDVPAGERTVLTGQHGRRCASPVRPAERRPCA